MRPCGAPTSSRHRVAISISPAGYGGGKNFRAARGKFGPFRLALLPIGAYAPRWFMQYAHMNPEEAVEAFLHLEANNALAIHFATFHQTDEPIDEPVRCLAAALRGALHGPLVCPAHISPQ